MKLVKFATQVDKKVLDELRAVAKETDKTISKLVTEALADYLQRVRIRPAFRRAMDEVLDEHDELLRRLAR
ncbi:MAG: ribbon-helix-helix domain-containing protein [Kofleriaceae bacterium]